MNKIYRLVWNRVLGALVVTSELAKAGSRVSSTRGVGAPRGRILGMSSLLAALALVCVEPALGGSLDGGTATGANGAIAIGTTATASGLGAIAMGNSGSFTATTTASSVDAMALGNGATATAQAATSIGVSAHATGDFSTSLGVGADANGSGSTSAGWDATALFTDTVAIGRDTTAGTASGGEGAVAIGSAASSTGVNAVALGFGSAAAGDSALSVGNAASASATDAVALGRGAAAADVGAVAIGAASSTAAAVATGSTTINGTIYNFAGAAPDSTVSIGAAATERTLTNVAAGRISTTSTDGINGSQLAATNAAVTDVDTRVDTLGGNTATNFGGGSTYDAATGGVSAPTYTLNGNTYNNVGDALSSLSTGGATSKYFHVNSILADSAATAADTIAIGPVAVASADSTVAIGAHSTASGAFSTAIGGNSLASGDTSLAIGDRSTATEIRAVALGPFAAASQVGALALGDAANAGQADAVALGTASVTAAAVGTPSTTIAGTSYDFAGTGPASTVSVGSVGAERTITNVAAGRIGDSSTDAINGSQLSATNSAVDSLDGRTDALGTTAATRLGGGSTYDPVTGAVSAPAYAVAGTTYNNVGDALDGTNVRIDNISNGGGIKYFHVDSVLDDSTAIGTDSVAAGPLANAEGVSSVAIGHGAGALSSDSVAMGRAAVAGVPGGASGETAIGATASATGDQASAFGFGSNAAGVNAIALGSASASAASAVAIGEGATAGDAGAVALGSGSASAAAVATPSTVIAGTTYGFAGTTPASTVSIGDAGTERTLTNVAAGRVSGTSTDGINGSQLFATNTAVTDLDTRTDALGDSTATHFGGGATYDPATGTVNAPTYSVGGNTYNNVGDAITNLATGGATSLYFRANSSLADAIAGGLDSVAIGPTAVTDAVDAVALGHGALAGQVGAVALGSQSVTATAVGTTGATIAGTTYNFAGTAPTSTVSIGDAGTERTLTHVAAGRVGGTSTDGVNGSQLFATNTAVDSLDVRVDTLGGNTATSFGGGATYDPATGTLSGPTYVVGGNTYNNVGDAIGNLATGGATSKYFHATSALADSTAIGTDSIAIGPVASAAATDTIAIGRDAVAGSATGGAGSAAFGTQASATGISSLALGVGATSTEDGAIALGSNAVTAAVVGTASAAIAGTTYNFAGTTPTSTVSIGDTGAERTLTNVAAGRISGASTDAVNGSQLFATNTAVTDLDTRTDTLGTTTATNLGGGSTYDPVSGAVNAPAYSVAGTTYNNVGDALDGTNVRIDNISNGGGIQYFRANSTLADSSAAGVDSVAIGPTAAVDAVDGVAIGHGALAGQVGAVALGAGSVTAAAVATPDTIIAGTTYNFAGAAPSSTISVGDAGTERTITHVAAGRLEGSSTDAVNGSQLYATNQEVTAIDSRVDTLGGGTATSLGGGATYDPATGTLGAPTYNVGGNTYSNVGDAISNLASGGATSKYFHVNSTLADSTVAGTDGVAIGPVAVASATNAVALGNGAVSDQAGAIALGSGSVTAAAVGTPNGTIAGASYNFAGQAPSSTLSVGAVGAERTVSNVAAGRLSGTSTDAVNGSQLFATNTAVTDLDTRTDTQGTNTAANFGGGSTYDPVTGAVSAPAYSVAGTTYNNVGDALDGTNVRIDNINNGGGILYFRANSTLADATAIGTDSVAAGPLASAEGTSAVALGHAAGALSNDSVALGRAAVAGVPGGNSGETAVGATASATGNQSSALGFASNAAGVSAIALGSASASGETAIAIGAGATAADPGAVALGAGAVTAAAVATPNAAIAGTTYNFAGTAPTSTVSVGDVGAERTITQVAAGRLSGTSTDAVNGSQLFATNTAVTDLDTRTDALGGSTATNLGGGSTYDPATGTVNAPTYSVGGSTYNNVGDAISNLANGGATSKYFRANSVLADATAGGLDSIAIGPTAVADAVDGVAMGHGASAGQAGAVALGAGSVTATAVGTASATIAGTNYSFAGTTPASTVSVGNAGAERTITHVAAGRLDAGSTDAVNGSQLYATNQEVTAIDTRVDTVGGDIAISLGGGATYDPATGTLVAPTYNVGGGTVNNVGDAITNLDGRTTTNTTAITNLGDQINSGQIGLVQQNSATRDITVAAATDGTIVNLAGTVGTRTLTGLSDGAISAVSTEAINGSQLHAANASIADIFGGGAAINPDGTLAAPTYQVTSNNYHNVGDAIEQIDTTLNTLATGMGVKYFVSNSTLSPAVAVGVNSTAMGPEALTEGEDAIAVGHGAVAGAQASGGVAEQTGSVAVGSMSSAPVTQATALGYGAQATEIGSVALGAGSVTEVAVATTGTTIAGTSYGFAGTAPASTVSVGSAGAERTITHVAAGRLEPTSTDAVNGSQLYATNQSVDQLATTISDINTGGGIRYFHANSSAPDSVATGAESVAIGPSAAATMTGSVAVGDGANAQHANSVALGAGSQTTVGAQSNYQAAYVGSSTSTGEANIGGRTISGVAAGSAFTDAVNVGQLQAGVDSAVNQSNSYTDARITEVGGAVINVRNLQQGAEGMFRVSQDTAGVPTVTGRRASAGGIGAIASGANSLAVGSDSAASGENAVAIGANAVVSGANSVALGAGSVASATDTVSVGSAGRERTVSNLAAGVGDTDAVNVAQLKASQAGGLHYDSNADGSANPESLTLNPGGNPATLHNVGPGTAANDAVNLGQLQQVAGDLHGDMWDLRRESRGGTASAMAMSGMPQATSAGRHMLAVGMGGYQGEVGMAVGMSGVSDDGRYLYKAQVTSNTTSDFGFAVGAGLQW
ncbi:MAG TPA: YadA-like family protein [Stenotrophomonas sp.]|jgi:autotransporter adhesin